MKMMWTRWRLKRRQPTEGLRVRRERSQSQPAVEADCKLREPCQELNYLKGCHPHIPGGHIRGRDVCGAAKEMGRRVIGGAAIEANGVIGPEN